MFLQNKMMIIFRPPDKQYSVIKIKYIIEKAYLLSKSKKDFVRQVRFYFSVRKMTVYPIITKKNGYYVIL